MFCGCPLLLFVVLLQDLELHFSCSKLRAILLCPYNGLNGREPDEKLLFLALSTVLNRVIRNLFAKLTLPLHGLTSLRTNCFISQKCHFMASLVIHTDESRATASLHLPCFVSTPNFIHTVLMQCVLKMSI